MPLLERAGLVWPGAIQFNPLLLHVDVIQNAGEFPNGRDVSARLPR
jgi:hypothetical protein